MDNIVAVVLAAALSGLAGAMVNGLVNRRKLGAEAAKIITDAAAGVVQTMKADREDLLKRIATLEKQVAGWRRQRRADRDAAMLHAAWDTIAIELLAKRGERLPPPPPLYAPDQREAS